MTNTTNVTNVAEENSCCGGNNSEESSCCGGNNKEESSCCGGNDKEESSCCGGNESVNSCNCSDDTEDAGCSCGQDHDHEHHDHGDDHVHMVTFENEDGTTEEYPVVDEFEIDGVVYVLVQNGDESVTPLRVEGEEGELVFLTEEEFEAVSEAYSNLVEDDEDEESEVETELQ